jgi:deazaflavin-dependent oxidoreductase (nitroreductase family)
MSFQIPPGGTRGARVPPSNAVTRALNRVAMSWHRRSGDTFQGQDLLYLTTVGAKTGQKRQTAVARFQGGEDAWLVVASAAGSAHHPAWYHNIAAHPDQVWIEFGGRQLRVTPTQLDADAHAQAWQRITQLQPPLCGVRAENRSRHPRHPALPRRLSPYCAGAHPGRTTRLVDGGSTASRRPGRMGRRTSSPPQFGQTPCRMFSAQSRHQVHSYVQISTSGDAGSRSRSQHSQFGRSSST